MWMHSSNGIILSPLPAPESLGSAGGRLLQSNWEHGQPPVWYGMVMTSRYLPAIKLLEEQNLDPDHNSCPLEEGVDPLDGKLMDSAHSLERSYFPRDDLCALPLSLYFDTPCQDRTHTVEISSLSGVTQLLRTFDRRPNHPDNIGRFTVHSSTFLFRFDILRHHTTLNPQVIINAQRILTKPKNITAPQFFSSPIPVRDSPARKCSSIPPTEFL
ncbi:hypothetical protein BJX63DRAFT_212038 [Aspergillus granulosus]|uniref:Uncharacterized protein n=1 Tax=Aspergillus granulosus TaxID=176169 RepID=A0ABR4HG17_9EURO